MMNRGGDKEQALISSAGKGKVQCPYCGSKEIAWILWGHPIRTEELDARIRDGEIVLREGAYSEYSPRYKCRKCNRVFGSLQVIKEGAGKDGKDLLLSEDTVIGVNYEIGGFFDGYDVVSVIRRGNLSAILFSHMPVAYDNPYFVGEFSGADWKKLNSKLFQKYFVHEWEREYVNPYVLDGTQWSLELELAGGEKYRICGSNAYPPMFRSLDQMFDRYMRKRVEGKYSEFDWAKMKFMFQNDPGAVRAITEIHERMRLKDEIEKASCRPEK